MSYLIKSESKFSNDCFFAFWFDQWWFVHLWIFRHLILSVWHWLLRKFLNLIFWFLNLLIEFFFSHLKSDDFLGSTLFEHQFKLRNFSRLHTCFFPPVNCYWQVEVSPACISNFVFWIWCRSNVSVRNCKAITKMESNFLD